jgi:hypothetical protein
MPLQHLGNLFVGQTILPKSDQIVPEDPNLINLLAGLYCGHNLDRFDTRYCASLLAHLNTASIHSMASGFSAEVNPFVSGSPQKDSLFILENILQLTILLARGLFLGPQIVKWIGPLASARNRSFRIFQKRRWL